MRIAVDARCLNREYLRGIGKVVTNIITHSPDSVKWTLFADRPDLPFHCPDHPWCEVEIFEQRGYRFRAWEQWAYPRRLSAERFDLSLSPANSAPIRQAIPTVAIIHDTVAWKPEWESESSGFFANRILLPRAFRRATSIVTISDASAADIGKIWPSLFPKITTIPNGVDSQFLDAESKAIPATVRQQVGSNKYFVYFGGAIERKRLNWAVGAFERAAVEDCDLLICGLEKCHQAEFKEKLSPRMREHIKVMEYIAEIDMPGLIQNSLGVLYPTLYEGFGLPALEAQASGTACLFSEVASLKELVGPGAILLPIDEPNAWSDALVKLAQQGGLNDETKDRSRQWATKYHWRETSRAYLSLFNRLVPKQSLLHNVSGTEA